MADFFNPLTGARVKFGDHGESAKPSSNSQHADTDNPAASGGAGGAALENPFGRASTFKGQSSEPIEGEKAVEYRTASSVTAPNSRNSLMPVVVLLVLLIVIGVGYVLMAISQGGSGASLRRSATPSVEETWRNQGWFSKYFCSGNRRSFICD